MTHEALYHALCALYPPTLSCPWDHDGIMVMKNGDKEPKKVLVALDCTNDCAKAAIAGGYDLIVTHHPLFFKPIHALAPSNPLMARGLLLYERGISVFSFHTRLDCTKGGVNDHLSELLELTDPTPFFVEDLPMGRVGSLKEAMNGRDFAALLKKTLGTPAIFCNLPDKKIKKVALLGGSGGGEWKDALLAGADCYVTGEAGYHHQLDAAESGLCMMVCGHDFTEKHICRKLQSDLLALCPEAKVDIFEKNHINCL